MLYTSIENKKIKEYKKLQNKKYREQTGLFLIEGEHLILEAFKTGFLKEIILKEGLECYIDVTTHYASYNVMKYLSLLDTPTTMIGICKQKQSNEIKENILLLDGIQDPGNLGTIIRSAVAFHTSTIIISKDSVDIYNSKVIRASQGMLFHINIIKTDLEQIIPKLKEQNYEILSTKVTDGESIKRVAKNKKFAIIMGNEGSGVKSHIEKLCDGYLYIPMSSSCESLNVGVATSIILYELWGD